jgi:hypothetical protein
MPQLSGGHPAVAAVIAGDDGCAARAAENGSAFWFKDRRSKFSTRKSAKWRAKTGGTAALAEIPGSRKLRRRGQDADEYKRL